MLKISELKGRGVIGLESARKLGALQGMVIDPGAAQIVGLKVSTGPTAPGPLLPGLKADANDPPPGEHLFIPAASVYSIGPDAITVREAGIGSLAEPTMESLPDSHALGNTKVVTDGGTLLGTISDMFINETNLQLMGYELAGSGLETLMGKGKFLRALPGYRYGGDLLLVPAAVAGDLQQGASAPAQRAPAGTVLVNPAPGPVMANSAPTEAVPQASPAPANPAATPAPTETYGTPVTDTDQIRFRPTQ